MHQDENGGGWAWGQRVPGAFEVAGVLLPRGSEFTANVQRGPRAERCDPRADERAMSLKESEQSAGFKIPAFEEISRKEGVCVLGMAVEIEVSQQKRDVVRHVDPTQCGVEFQAIEGQETS